MGIRFGSVLLVICALFCVRSVFSWDDDTLTGIGRLHQEWRRATSIPEAARFIRRAPNSLDISDGNSMVSTPLSSLLNDSDWASNSRAVKGPEFFPKCADDLVQILFNLESGWALRMLDSNGKMMSGISEGSLTWPGFYQECLNVYSPLDNKDHGDFYGRYCTSSWFLNLTEKYSKLPLSVGVCVPNSCEGDDIANAIANVLKLSKHVPLVQKLVPRLTLESVACKTGVNPPDAATIIYLIIIAIFLALVACGSSITAYEYLTRKPERPTSFAEFHSSHPLNPKVQPNYGAADHGSPSAKEYSGSINSSDPTENLERGLIEERKHQPSAKKSSARDFFLCFCAFTNGSKILNTDVASSQLSSIHGIRFLSLTWVIIGHTYITAVSDISNKLQTLKDIDGFSFQMLMNSPFSVDSFFLLSGTLLAYLYFKEAERRNGKISWAYFYLHRIWRITPVYMLLVGFYMLVYKYMGSGPFWKDDHGDSCRHTWWWYLLYINNFIPIQDMCVGWSWYLANDMQFYIISPLFLYTMWRWRKVGLSIVLTLLAGSWIVTGILTAKYDIIPMLAGVTEVVDIQSYQEKMWNSFDIIYDKPYTRISPYLVGILLGYALHKVKDKRNFLNWWQKAFGWCTAVFLSASVIFGLYHVEITRAISILHNAFGRTAFTMGLAWMIFACETGHGGIIHKLLSWNFWVPLSRLTYCAYLVHPLLVHGYYDSLQTVLYFTHTTVVTVFLGILVASYVLAFAVSFTFESPMMNLEKLLLKRPR